MRVNTPAMEVTGTLSRSPLEMLNTCEIAVQTVTPVIMHCTVLRAEKDSSQDSGAQGSDQDILFQVPEIWHNG